MEILKKLKSLAEKPRSKWTAKDREFIVALAAENGVQVNPLCPDCYFDTAIILLKKLRQGEENPIAGGYQLRPGLDVYHNGIRVNAELLTEENAKKWIAAGLPLRYFTKLPDDAN